MTDAAPIATRDAWRLAPLPAQRDAFDVEIAYPPDAFSIIVRGSIPQQMEDKWFVFYEAPWLYLHRSWTGYAIYGVRFVRDGDVFRAVEAWVNRDPAQYGGANIDDDGRLVRSLIDGLLRDAAEFAKRK